MAVASFLIFSLLYTTVHSTRCYSSKGDPFVYTDEEPIEAWMPCDLTAEVSNCCSPRDYCMSNGLCLDAVQDNMMSQQGCTDSDWAEPCLNYCGDTEADAGGLHFLWRCNKQEHCCSNNRTSTCCNDPDVHIFNVEVGLTLHFPPTVATAAATTASTGTASDTSAATATTTGLDDVASSISQMTAGSTTAIMSSSTASAEAASQDSSKNDTRNMAIGLGVGVPLGIALIASIVFMAMQMRKKKAVVDEKPEAGGVSRNPSTSYYSNDAQVGQYHTQPQYYGHNYDYTGGAKSAGTVPSELGMRDPGELGVRDEYAELDGNRGRL